MSLPRRGRGRPPKSQTDKTPEQRSIDRAEQRQQQQQQQQQKPPPGAMVHASAVQMSPFLKILEKAETMITEVCEATIIQPNRLIYIARAGLSRSPQLLECTPLSWVGALMDCAQLGLEPIGALGQFYFVPFRNWNKSANQYQMEVNGQLGYLGITELARRSGEILYVKSEAVYMGDEFYTEEGSGTDVDGKVVASFFRHKPRFDRRTDNITAAWALAHFKTGEEVFRVIGRLDLDKSRARSQSAARDDAKPDKPQMSPWNLWESQMSAKTAVRRLRPYLPQNTILAKSLAVDEAIDIGAPARWRELGAHGEKIDSFLGDLEAHPTMGPSVQVPKELPESASKPEEKKKEQPKEEKPKEKKEEPPQKEPNEQPKSEQRTKEEILAAFKGFRIAQADLEAGVVTEGEPPMPMDDWGDDELAFFSVVLDRVKEAEGIDQIKDILMQELHLDRGFFG